MIPRAALLLLLLAGCAKLPVTPLEDLYDIDVITTGSSYAVGDSVYERITNRNNAYVYWHRCPGIRLLRKTSSGWIEVSGDGTCSVAAFGINPGETLTVRFALPGGAPAGSYRADVWLSAGIPDSRKFWWPSNTFSVTGGQGAGSR